MPRRLITDKLRSYSAACRTVMPSVLHCTDQYANNRAEVSHQPTRQRERQMRRFTSASLSSSGSSVHGIVQNLFRVGRHLLRSAHHRLLRTSPMRLTRKWCRRVGHPKYKTTYRVGNWREYERALVQRGDVTLWLSAAATDAWRPSPAGRPGGQKRFSDVAIETALILRLVFGLPLRQTEGFVRSVLALMGADLDAPDHTTLSRRSQQLAVMLRRIPATDPLHLIVDSTGLSIVGQGAWAAAKHGGHGERRGKKLHLGVDKSGVIVAQALTDAHVDDATTAVDLIPVRWRYFTRHRGCRLRYDRGLRGGGRAWCAGRRSPEEDRRRVSPTARDPFATRSYRQAGAGDRAAAMEEGDGLPSCRRADARTSSSGTSPASERAFARGVQQGRGPRRSSRVTC